MTNSDTSAQWYLTYIALLLNNVLTQTERKYKIKFK